MRILFVDNLLLKRDCDEPLFDLQPHNGLISLTAILRKQGYDVGLYDPKIDIVNGKLAIDANLYKKIANVILANNPDVVGFTSLGCNFICTLKIAQYIKKNRAETKILLGGPHATVLHREIISAFGVFDVIVRNEAELTIVPVVEGLLNNQLDTVSGITYKENDTIISTSGTSTIKDLSILPFPDYEAYPIGNLNLTFMRVEAGRGCPFSCTFCSTATFFGRSYRLKPAKTICNELDYLFEHYGISDFGLIHDLFTVNRLKVIEFCEEVSKRNYTWRCSARMDCVDEELLMIMRNAGCTSIYYGVETGSARMQLISKKKLDLKVFDEILNITLSLGIRPTLSFITGYPEEEMEDCEATLDLLCACIFRECESRLHLQLHLLAPEPGTALHQQYSANMGFDNYLNDFNFPTLEDDDEIIMKSHPDIFMNHHYYNTVLPRHFFVITTSLFDTLRSLGFVICRYILNHFSNSLTELNRTVYEWAKGEYVDKIDPYTFTLFISKKFTCKHVLTSLVRYRSEVLDLIYLSINRKAKNNNEANENESNTVSVPEIRLLRDIHDYVQIINLLSANKPINKKLLQKQYDFILNPIINDKDETIVENYKLTHDAYDIIQPIEKRIKSKTDIFLSNFMH